MSLQPGPDVLSMRSILQRCPGTSGREGSVGQQSTEPGGGKGLLTKPGGPVVRLTGLGVSRDPWGLKRYWQG